MSSSNGWVAEWAYDRPTVSVRSNGLAPAGTVLGATVDMRREAVRRMTAATYAQMSGDGNGADFDSARALYDHAERIARRYRIAS
jgi:hypothetical protein